MKITSHGHLCERSVRACEHTLASANDADMVGLPVFFREQKHQDNAHRLALKMQASGDSDIPPWDDDTAPEEHPDTDDTGSDDFDDIDDPDVPFDYDQEQLVESVRRALLAQKIRDAARKDSQRATSLGFVSDNYNRSLLWRYESASGALSALQLAKEPCRNRATGQWTLELAQTDVSPQTCLAVARSLSLADLPHSKRCRFIMPAHNAGHHGTPSSHMNRVDEGTDALLIQPMRPTAVHIQRMFSPERVREELAQLLPEVKPTPNDPIGQHQAYLRAAIGLERKQKVLGGQLCNLLGDENHGLRLLPVATPAMIDAVERFDRLYPNMASLTRIVVSQLRASFETQTPFRLPAFLLLGKPGIGKTTGLMALREALGLHAKLMMMSTTTHVAPFSGMEPNWALPSMGAVAECLLQGGLGSLLIVDELEKTGYVNRDNGDPLAALHMLLEGATAREFTDDYLSVPFAADSLSLMATANAIDRVQHSILDRFIIIDIKAPSTDQMNIVVENAYFDVAAGYEGWFSGGLEKPLVNLLLGLQPRLLKRVLSMAMAAAIGERRHHLTEVDIETFVRILQHQGHASRRRPIGFISRHESDGG